MKKELKLKKKDSKKKSRIVKWVVGVVGVLAALFVVFILLFPDVFRGGQWDRIRGMCVFSGKFDSESDSWWLDILGNLCPHGDYVDFSRFPFLKEIVIGDKAYGTRYGNVLISGLKRLKTVNIGKGFNIHSSGSDNTVEISHCPSLTSITIGDYSFEKYKELILSGLFFIHL